jgi:hypothetical protein
VGETHRHDTGKSRLFLKKSMKIWLIRQNKQTWSRSSVWGYQDTSVYKHFRQCAITLLKLQNVSYGENFLKKISIITQFSKKIIYHFPLSVPRQSLTPFSACKQLPASSRKLHRKAKRCSRGFKNLRRPTCLPFQYKAQFIQAYWKSYSYDHYDSEPHNYITITTKLWGVFWHATNAP